MSAKFEQGCWREFVANELSCKTGNRGVKVRLPDAER